MGIGLLIGLAAYALRLRGADEPSLAPAPAAGPS
jgi:hypothetical protein